VDGQLDQAEGGQRQRLDAHQPAGARQAGPGGRIGDLHG
jgi:hypothetical protein